MPFDELREKLRLLMLEQPTTRERETYNDGFAQGLAYAIQEIDRMEQAVDPAPEHVVWEATLDRRYHCRVVRESGTTALLTIEDRFAETNVQWPGRGMAFVPKIIHSEHVPLVSRGEWVGIGPWQTICEQAVERHRRWSA